MERLEVEWIKPFKEFHGAFNWFIKNRPDLVKNVVHKIGEGDKATYALTILDGEQIQRIMERVYDEKEFLAKPVYDRNEPPAKYLE